MKSVFPKTVFIFIMLKVTASIGLDVTPTNDVEKKLLDFFVKWRSGDTASLPFLVPSLEVLYIPPINGSYSGKGVKLTYSSSRIRLIGMNNFYVTKLNVSLGDMFASGSLVIPMLAVSADMYNVEGSAFYVYTLRGSGKLRAMFKSVKLGFIIRLARNGTHTNVSEFNLDFAIGDIQVDLENSSWPINKILNKEGVKIIEGYHEDIVNATETNIVQRLDTYLTTVSPTQLINMMQQAL